MRRQMPIFLPAGKLFYGSILTDGARYQFTSTYRDKRLQPIPVWVVTPPKDIKKVQLRAFVRLDIGLSVSLKILEGEDIVDLGMAITRNISGGGLCLITKQALKAGTKVFLVIELDKTSLISVAGEVVRSEKQNDDTPFYVVGVKYEDIIERDRSQIIKFIFQKQIEIKRKGL